MCNAQKKQTLGRGHPWHERTDVQDTRSGGRTVPTKRLFKENAPFIFFILVGPFARTLFSRTLLPWPILCYSGQILHARFSNTSFGRTLLGSDFGASCSNKHFVDTLRPSHQGSQNNTSQKTSGRFFCSNISWGPGFRLTLSGQTPKNSEERFTPWIFCRAECSRALARDLGWQDDYVLYASVQCSLEHSSPSGSGIPAPKKAKSSTAKNTTWHPEFGDWDWDRRGQKVLTRGGDEELPKSCPLENLDFHHPRLRIFQSICVEKGKFQPPPPPRIRYVSPSLPHRRLQKTLLERPAAGRVLLC